MRLLVFTVVGLAAWVVAYGLALGGTVGVLLFLFILFIGIVDRWSEPVRARLRA